MIRLEDVVLSHEQTTRLLAMRGGCSCFSHPPCSACCDPLKMHEAAQLGIDLEEVD